MLFQRTDSDARIDNQSIVAGVKEIAVTTTTAAKRYESQHVVSEFKCKDTKKNRQKAKVRKLFYLI